MMPQIGQAADRSPDPGELAARARAALGDLERSKDALLRRSAAGEGGARVLLAAMVVLRDFAAKADREWFAAVLGSEREMRALSEENARLRADLEEARQRVPGRRGRHAGERPLWPRAVRGAAPLSVVPAGLRLLGHHAAAKAILGGVAASTAAAVAIGAGVTQAVPYQTPAPVPHAAWHAPAAVIYGAVPAPRDSASAAPRARTAAQSASPAASAVPSPPAISPAASPPAPAPAPPAAPALTVPRLLDLGAVTRGPLTLSAGAGAVTWTARTTDGITLSSYAGVAVPGQPVTLEVTDPDGDGGWIYLSAGPDAFAVRVTSDLGAPVPAQLPRP